RRFDGLSHFLDEVGDPRPPPGGDVGVHFDHVLLLHRGHRGERGTAQDVVHAARVGDEDEVGVLFDDELRGQLRVAARGVFCFVGDVDQAEQVVDLPDEGVGGHRVQLGVDLVVVAQPGCAVVDDLRDDGVHAFPQFFGCGDAFVGVAGGFAQQFHLGEGVFQFLGGGQQQDRDVELLQLFGDVAAVAGEHHQIGFVVGDRLHVGGEPGQVGGGGFRRVVGVFVDGDDLVAGAHLERDLGQGRGQRDDAGGLFFDGDVAARVGDGHGELSCAGRLVRGGFFSGGAAGGEGKQERKRQRGEATCNTHLGLLRHTSGE